MRYYLVIPAAGSGRRFDASQPKQYARLGDTTVIEQALAPFEADADCAGIVVAVAAGDSTWPPIAQRRTRVIETAQGGEQRAHSVRNALRALVGRARDDDWVMVHDAARPCLTPGDLQALKRELASHPVGGLLAVPLADTLKRALEPGTRATHVDETVDRDGLWRAATPQVFRFSVMPLVAPLGRGGYSRPHLYLIYTVSRMNDDAFIALYDPKDVRYGNNTVHYIGTGVEWWFNSSYR